MTLRVLTISKPYVAAAYRHKFELLAQDPRFTIGLICPKAWGTQTCEPSPKSEPFWFQTLPIRANGRHHFHTYRGLEAAIEAFAPDVLNVEEEHYSIVTAQAFLCARKRRIPALFYTWQNIAKRYPPPFSWIEQMVFRQAAVAIGGNSESLAILRQKGFRGTALEIPQMGVQMELFAPQSSEPSERRAAKKAVGLNEDDFWIGFVGRLVEEKGIQVLLEALAQVDLPHVKLFILGDGPYGRELHQMASDRGIAHRVTFLPSVPSAQVPSYLKAIDALCLPSLTRHHWKEQFGRVLIEAMAAEALVLGSSSGEIPRVIADAGLIHPEGDSKTLAMHLKDVATDSNKAESLRKKASERVRALFSNQIIASKFAHAFILAAEKKSPI